MKYGFKTTALGAALAAVVAGPVPAHAAAGNMSGAAACAAAVREYKGAMPNATLVRGWMYGATSALHQASPGAFDFVPWHDLNTVANSIGGFCAQKPKMDFAQAVSGLSSALGNKRLKAASAPVKLGSDGQSVARYGKALAGMARALLANGASF